MAVNQIVAELQKIKVLFRGVVAKKLLDLLEDVVY